MITFALLVLATATASLTISRSALFSSVRKFCNERFPFFGDLFKCPYCTAHWVSFLFTLVCWMHIPKVTWFGPLNVILIGLAVVPFTIPLMVMMYEGIPRLAIEE